ncbi:hypothetical protein [Hymenobacter metallilatus]|uniref:Uncharacterized protein n=1 Tax=Hymenobacter metallilatus TaxID=2493666 RepID=A0A428JQS3_9BACT|nr:hypothetical protein [Hymenobacter metallilatus]RSK35960.1 hypothetical protein EI290_03445 [Hymenobacter metallilatus]
MNLLHPIRVGLPVLVLLAACTTTETVGEEAAVQRPPTRILTDADRQAAYNSNAGYGGSVPDATPGRVPIREQASGINSRKRPETLNTNDNNTTTPETRMRRVNGAPADTLRLPR